MKTIYFFPDLLYTISNTIHLIIYATERKE